jgi:hypothetical protein
MNNDITYSSCKHAGIVCEAQKLIATHAKNNGST